VEAREIVAEFRAMVCKPCCGSWPVAIIAGLRSSMIGDPGGTISLYVEHLDLYHFDGPRYEDTLRSHFSEK
jgi:hypothetical protein